MESHATYVRSMALRATSWRCNARTNIFVHSSHESGTSKEYFRDAGGRAESIDYCRAFVADDQGGVIVSLLEQEIPIDDGRNYGKHVLESHPNAQNSMWPSTKRASAIHSRSKTETALPKVTKKVRPAYHLSA